MLELGAGSVLEMAAETPCDAERALVGAGSVELTAAATPWAAAMLDVGPGRVELMSAVTEPPPVPTSARRSDTADLPQLLR
jgi:hypothetical protein